MPMGPAKGMLRQELAAEDCALAWRPLEIQRQGATAHTAEALPLIFEINRQR